MGRPCGTFACVEYIERCGGEPSSPSDYICWGCGMDGPMSDYLNRQRIKAEKHGEDDGDSNEE